MVGPPGFEPGTSPLSGARSDQLSYEPGTGFMALGEGPSRAPYHGLALIGRSACFERPVGRFSGRAAGKSRDLQTASALLPGPPLRAAPTDHGQCGGLTVSEQRAGPLRPDGRCGSQGLCRRRNAHRASCLPRARADPVPKPLSKEHLPQTKPRGDQAPRGTAHPQVLRTIS